MNNILNNIDKLLNENYDYKKTSEELVELYYYIGKYLYENESSFKYKVIYELEEVLRNKYGLVIGFTKRNLINMLNFYKAYDIDIKILKQVEWNIHLFLLKQNNKIELLNYCLKYNINKQGLKKIIKEGFNEKYTLKNKLEEDSMTLEFISLKK